MKVNAQHVVMVSPADYDRMQESEDVLSELLLLNTAAADRDVLETIARAFMAHFDVERADEWGHVSYCMRQTLATAVHVARQEARKR